MSVAKLTIELDELKDELSKLEKDHASKNSTARNGAIAFLLGLIIAFAFSWWIGGFLVLIGLLTWLSNFGSRNTLARQVKEKNQEIADKRKELKEAASNE